MKITKKWFQNLSTTGKVLIMSAIVLLSLGTIGAFAKSGSAPEDNTGPASSHIPAGSQTPSPVKTVETKTEIIAFQDEFKEDGMKPFKLVLTDNEL